MLHDEVAEEMAERRNAASMRLAVAMGVVIGVLGSAWVYLV